MSIAFDERKMLPPGIHDATLKQIEGLMGKFQKSDRRIKLFRKLTKYVDEVKKTGWQASILLDGSFVMGGVDEPGDIDLILVLPADWDFAQELRPFEYNVVSKKDVFREFEIEVKVVRSGSEQDVYYTSLFTQVNIKSCQAFGWPPDSTKGLIRIIP